MPGTGAGSWAELDAQLRSAAGAWVQHTLLAGLHAGATIAASCAAVGFAAAAGLLDGRAATTAWFLAPEFARRFPAVRLAPERVLVESGRCRTGGAALAHADVMLRVVERFAGAALAEQCARYLLLDRRQSQRADLVLQALLAGDPRLVAAERFVHAHMHTRFSIAALAAAVGVGEHTFGRLVQRTCGCSPIQLVQQMRVNAARELLREGHSVEAVAPHIGYADGTALRRVMRQHTGSRPAGGGLG